MNSEENNMPLCIDRPMGRRYLEHGYKNRPEYLQHLAATYNIDFEIVRSIAFSLGADEDFDGLITCLENYEGFSENCEDCDK